jgi:hypothetical protein
VTQQAEPKTSSVTDAAERKRRQRACSEKLESFLKALPEEILRKA